MLPKIYYKRRSKMIKLKHLINLIALFAIFIPVQGQSTNVTITGKVIDANTSDPISGATVIISTGFGQGIESDTLKTDSNGEINGSISLDSSAYGIAYSISADGYAISNSYAMVSSNTIDIGTVELTPNSEITPDTVIIKAQVYYTGTETAVENSDLLMYAPSGFELDSFNYDNPDIQTLTSNSEGNISGYFFVESSNQNQFNILRYALTLKDSKSNEGTSFIQGDTVDLGVLYIDKPNTPISFNAQIKIDKSQIDQVQVYTLNGQLIYSGKTLDLIKIKNTGISVNQQLLIVEKCKGKILTVLKRQLYK